MKLSHKFQTSLISSYECLELVESLKSLLFEALGSVLRAQFGTALSRWMVTDSEN